MDPRQLGVAINQQRLAHGLTQYDLADAAEVSRSYISLFERGRRVPSAEELDRIAAVLDTTAQQLRDDTGRAAEDAQQTG